ncbi:MAG: hypothetical protein DKM50_04490 [Candidatus Margulisiibacteriota bacterium]|nr:MAG: hypothetical protein A2X43_05630 [Candidatus Margulisbacteria bacterium GWD2_39_127]OGI01035.1 MAG: hypothetical protein A2X42_12270 [Candidatus Margulisbacteria bacterium GWF2_38_17]OGI09564.1 MAG: hypothetical protein A2X41_06475 [Candidatus Margulisbacteria bacterium GWE2_39_32]PZM82009.1 MAG: hypothetical protein DKM50_04490 [Candidatus Margulisiibacteriota bacterium]HCY35870.1 hypothetical protein [Candidatus Margulisiibacteriota bacterium]
MADSINAGSGGGIHPGAPVIWPSSKQVQQVQQTQQTQQAGQAVTVPAQAAKETSVTQQIAQQAQQAQQFGKPTIARSLSKTDISAQLVQLGLPVTNDNIQLANKMLLHGLELSSENFNSLFNILKNTGGQSSTQQAALVALSKGLQNEQGVIKPLESFLANNPQLAKQLLSLNNAMESFKSSILGGRNLLSPQLLTQLTQILTAMDDKYKKLLNGESGIENFMEKFLRGGSLEEMRALKSLLFGVAKQLMNNPNEALSRDSKQLAKAFIGLGKSLDEVMQNITAQAILSKPASRQDAALPDKYAYWQIPNTMGQMPGTLEILIKRDEGNKNAKINPNRTRIILKVESEELGEITIMVDIEDKSIWYVFNNENDKVREFIMANAVILRDRMNQLNWNVKGVQSIRRTVDLKKYLIPTINIDTLKRISTEA